MQKKECKMILSTQHWKCPKCYTWKPSNGFYEDKRTANKLKSQCKCCHLRAVLKTRNVQNTRRINREHMRRSRKMKSSQHNKEMRIYRKKYPWVKPYRAALERCTNKNCHKYRRYGRRGIKFMLTMEEIKTLWFRDKAYTLEVPSIDRINNEGHYEYSNCRFIERHENSRKGAK